jgi:hypothetical protein
MGTQTGDGANQLNCGEKKVEAGESKTSKRETTVSQMMKNQQLSVRAFSANSRHLL